MERKKSRATLRTARDSALHLGSELLKDRELGRLLQVLTADAIANANFECVFARIKLARIQELSQRQALARVTIAFPVFGLLADLFAVFQQNIINVDRRAQRGLVDAGVVDLHVDADWRAAMISARHIRNDFQITNREHSDRRLITKSFQLNSQHESRRAKLIGVIFRNWHA